MPPRGRGDGSTDKGKSSEGERDVLQGPTRPFWVCKACEEESNFASRVVCRGCNRDAPKGIINKARAAHARAVEEGKDSDKGKREGEGRRQPRRGANSRPRESGKDEKSPHSAKELQDLRKKIRLLEAASAGSASDKPTSEGDMEDEPGGEKSLDELLSCMGILTKNLGPDDPATLVMATRVQEARQRRDADKTPLARVQTAMRRRDKAQKTLDKTVAAEEAAKEKVITAQEEVLQAGAAVREAQQLLGQETAALAEVQDALAKESAEKAKAAGYRAPVAEPQLLDPGAMALLAGCTEPNVQEALAFVHAQLLARHRQVAEEERERDREHQMAEEADAATAAWREEMGDAGGADGARPAGAQEDDEVLRILLATRMQCLRDPAARHALLQLHATARDDAGGQHGEGWHQQLEIHFADGSKAKRPRKEAGLGAAAERGASD